MMMSTARGRSSRGRPAPRVQSRGPKSCTRPIVEGLLRPRRSRTRGAVSSTFREHRSVAGQPLRWSDELRDLREHAALLFELVHRDLTVRYKRSVLGFLWTMLHPLLLMLIFLIVFSALFRAGAPHYETYFLSASVAWNFFARPTVNPLARVAWHGPLVD